MNLYRMKLLTRSRRSVLHGGCRADRMEWIRLQVRNEHERLVALSKLGDKWILAQKEDRDK